MGPENRKLSAIFLGRLSIEKAFFLFVIFTSLLAIPTAILLYFVEQAVLAQFELANLNLSLSAKNILISLKFFIPVSILGIAFCAMMLGYAVVKQLRGEKYALKQQVKYILEGGKEKRPMRTNDEFKDLMSELHKLMQ